MIEETTKHKIQRGDLIYYFSPNGETVPSKVLDVRKWNYQTSRRAKITGLDGKSIWVSTDNCKLQDDYK